jgi:hypothetical protein
MKRFEVTFDCPEYLDGEYGYFFITAVRTGRKWREVKRTPTEYAGEIHGVDAKIVSIEWIGVRSKEKFGNDYFRVARVYLEANDGRGVYKYATIDTSNGFTIR